MPGAGNPQALNRYAYGWNNPVKYTDPTGHCAGNPGAAQDSDCWDKLFRIEKDYGITLDGDWQIPEMDDFLSPGLQAIVGKVGMATFRNIWSNVTIKRFAEAGGSMCRDSYACASGSGAAGGTVYFYQGVFKIGTIGFIGDLAHEFAHLWDGNYDSYLSTAMAGATGSHWTFCIGSWGECGSPKPWNVSPGRTQQDSGPYAAWSYAGQNPVEDFAVAFQYWVIGRSLSVNDGVYTSAQFTTRVEFIQGLLTDRVHPGIVGAN